MVLPGAEYRQSRGEVRYFVNETMDKKAFNAPANLAGDTVFVGYKRFKNSRCPGLSGDIQWAAIYDGVCLSPIQHQTVFRTLAHTPGSEELPAASALPAPSFELDPSKPDWQRQLVKLEGTNMHVRRIDHGGRVMARFNGEASASVDLDRNQPLAGDHVEFKFAFKLDSTLPPDRQIVLCTTGGGDRSLRIVVDGTKPQTVQLRVDAELTPVATFDPQAWTRVGLCITADECAAAIDDGASVTLPFPTRSTWLFLGQGYLESLVPANLAFEVDLATVQSRVVAP